MATRTQTQVGLNNLGGANTLTTATRQDDDIDDNLPAAGFGRDEVEEEQDTTGKRSVSQLVRMSSLLPLKVVSKLIFSTCFFEPLEYCTRGYLTDGFCNFHEQFMFNVCGENVGMVMKDLRRRTVFVKTPRKLIKYPVELRPDFIKVFPLLELFDDIEEFENNLDLSLFAYNLLQKYKKPEDVTRIVNEHKAYIMRIVRMYTTSTNTTRVEDAKIGQYMEAWIKDRSNDLLANAFNIKLIYMDDQAQLRWINLSECSILTQMIVLLFENPYVISKSLNNACLSVPAAYTIVDRCIALDCTKAAHGTLTKEGITAYGDPATISMFRSDNNESISFVRDNYNPEREICFGTKVDKIELLKTVQIDDDQYDLGPIGGVAGVNGGVE